MPRSTREIIDQADALAHRFEEHVSDLSNARSADTLRHVRQAFLDRARAEKELLVAVQSARSDNQSWSAIGRCSALRGRRPASDTDPRSLRIDLSSRRKTGRGWSRARETMRW